MGTISCHSNQSSYLTGIKNITFRSPIPIAAIYVEYGKNLPHASEEMSFENVDRRTTDGRRMPVYTRGVQKIRGQMLPFPQFLTERRETFT